MEIWISASDGSAPVRLTYYGAEPGSPRWSPDGTEIAFDLTAHGNADIYVMSSNGGEPRRLTFDASDERIPTWSRDGKTIYFTSNRTGTQEIWRIPAYGGQATQVTHNGGLLAFESRVLLQTGLS
jgi:Tol biopolymer transport system component